MEKNITRPTAPAASGDRQTGNTCAGWADRKRFRPRGWVRSYQKIQSHLLAFPSQHEALQNRMKCSQSTRMPANTPAMRLKQAKIN